MEREKNVDKNVGLVATYPETLENSKEAGGETRGTQRSIKICTSTEELSPLSRVIRVLVISIIDILLGRSMRVV